MRGKISSNELAWPCAATGHGIGGIEQLVATFLGIAGRAFNAGLSGDAAKNNGIRALVVQLQVKIVSLACTPLALENRNVAGLAIKFLDKVVPVRCHRRGGPHGLTGRRMMQSTGTSPW